ncbi:MAG TPA: sigma-70 family RNA polymerase sigma factor [Verrucomicrobiae bacterium]|nr:sigma-70 family RNA polymerase sigma factor [Verrucomicrobiae bacterium]
MNPATEPLSQANSKRETFCIEAIFREQYPRVARIIARVVRDHARAEELAVEVFLKLWRNPKAQRYRVEAWLYRVALRMGLDELRSRSRRWRYETFFGLLARNVSPATPEQIHRASEEQDRVRLVLSLLKSRQAELLVLCSHGSRYGEIASILDLNPASVGTLLARAQQAFRKEYTRRYGLE